ncbi:RNA polymerase sigma factor [Mangrovibacterium sp.]|uniref:RNA polymerase sigma factor n=1 Tax=Mangrovibacterium sp. TaxID=1961364 RepID=UPI00356B13D0
MKIEKTQNELSVWVETYTQDLYSWALHKVSDVEIAQDLVQDTFFAAVEKAGTFNGDSSPKNWLFSILNHKISDHYRKKVMKKEVEVVDDLNSRLELLQFYLTNNLTQKAISLGEEILKIYPGTEDVKQLMERLRGL